MPQLDIVSSFNQIIYIYIFFFIFYFIVLFFITFSIKKASALKQIILTTFFYLKKGNIFKLSTNFRFLLNKKNIILNFFSKEKKIFFFTKSYEKIKNRVLKVLQNKIN